MSNVPSASATLSGASASERCAARGKYSSIDLPLNQVVPSPGRRITRATEVFRLPVPLYVASSLMRRSSDFRRVERSLQTDAQAEPAHPESGAASVASSLHLQLRRRLRLVRMLGACVDLQLADLGARQAVAGKHPLDGLAQHLGRPALEL